MIAGEKYAHYVCDECGDHVTADGAVTLSRTTPIVVWAARCPAHRKSTASAARAARDALDGSAR